MFYAGSRESKWFWHFRRLAPSCESGTSLGGNHGRLCLAAASAGQGNDHRGTPGVSLGSGGTVTEQVTERQEN